MRRPNLSVDYRAKLDTAAVDTDYKTEKITYKKFKDNCIDKLQPDRFERHPTTAPSKCTNQKD